MQIVKSFVRRLREARIQYTPLISVRVYKDSLRENLEAFQNAHPQLGIAPVLKSNAYGHGLVGIAHILDNEGAPFFCVDTYAEALILHNEGIRTPILILGYSIPDNMRRCSLPNVAFTISSIDALRSAIALKSSCVCHLKIDTGMHRQGILPEEIPQALALLKGASFIRLEGVMTHLADADGEDPACTLQQIRCWNECVMQIKNEIPFVQYAHCSATEGSRYAEKIDANTLRLGIGLYGCTKTAPVSVQPALELVSLVSEVRNIKVGESIGYNSTYTAPHDIRVATVPVGYAEGVDRRLSNKGAMIVRGAVCPIVGRVSMNMTTIDVTDVVAVRAGDKVIAISKNREDQNSCESIARLCDTIPHEILVHIPPTLRHVYC